MKSEEMSLSEKTVCMALFPKAEPLDFPLSEAVMDNGSKEMLYEIPESEKQKVFDELNPFVEVEYGKRMFDIHEGKEFDTRDFEVIRCRDRNMIVSPYYRHSGGMIVDWVARNETNEQTFTIKKPKGEANEK